MHLATFLELLGNRHWKDIDEQLFGASLLGGQVRMRPIQLFHCLVELDELSAQLQLGHHLMRKAAKRLSLFEGQLTRLEIEDTKCPQRITFFGYKRYATIELEVRFARDKGDLIESGILPQIRRYDHLGAANRRCAEGDFARTLVEPRRQPILGFYPQPILA